MADTKCLGINNFLYICIFMITFWNYIHTSAENGFTENHSASFLDAVPKKLPAQTVELDLSHNTISELQISDFKYLSKLQILILSHNFIRDLDFSVFQYNEDLEYLDLSHNNLSALSCHLVASLQYLDLSYNNYTAMPICPEFGKMSKLEHLSLSARRIEKSDFSVLAHLQLGFLFLGLEDISEYGKLPVFNTKSLGIALPKNREFSILLDLEVDVTESLTLSNMRDKQVHDLTIFLSNLPKKGRLLNLTLNNIEVSWNTVTTTFQAVWQSTIEYFSIYNLSLLEVTDSLHPSYLPTSLKALTIKGTELIDTEFDQRYVYQTFSDMNIASLTISDSKMLQMLCPPKANKFTYLCFSNNQLTDMVFKDCNNLTRLETLILQKNKLQLLTRVSLMTSLMKSLKVMDVSQNSLRYENSEKCSWGKNLINLNLSTNRLSDSVFRCLPVNIQVLDLQKNQISSIPKDIIELSHLEELNLASNKLTDLPGCGQFRGLRLLNVERNSGFFQSSEFSQSCQNIKRLKAGHNPFTCSCELRQLINLEKQGFVKFVGWPESYVCSSPGVLKGTLLTDFHISEFVCSTTLQVVVFLIIALVLAAAVSFLCFRYDVPWYLKMIWQWTRVKHRVWKKKPEGMIDNVQFHVFISYSERDSDWVKNVLIPNLEKEDGSVRICQHERNFIAGKSIVENIIDCIEKSYKSIFVLSPNFVQSEWCHYELYFAHHRLFNENADGLILLLLESIPSYIIPARYHKLKALMAKRTYLEWPREKSKHGLFWANLKASINIKLPSSEVMEYL
ncbi:toll-like receptor 6 [Hemicordylus capensis]|uniref:toll-like receptor 6 n=1 Tax=Hemicordylus capensis TaxID=884348 RepID=UPI0023032A58|nr:toll-like receptor 6 [Hemicordylus capensis]XP_053108343.1 toll-like receptor 6 [Hemicordylus capensis]XP_053108344.1 toll-like receptor 6 [Hemicordylus capensis]XP_053108345.1 toll-like receptor 6 [Hemicordylus capensis]XP_053108346.1 toll-like receptor 6 [Hemicordylus capensis]XP_053108347.1 toll-like receptor 6 [Hemicordylus capensis]XP_053108348.1 toll-like receptor 6 [Hemicordylus capensis]